MIESLLIVSVGVVLAVLSLLASITAANTLFAETFGLMISSQILSPSNITALGLIYLTAILVTLLPALRPIACPEQLALLRQQIDPGIQKL